MNPTQKNKLFEVLISVTEGIHHTDKVGDATPSNCLEVLLEASGTVSRPETARHTPAKAGGHGNNPSGQGRWAAKP